MALNSWTLLSVVANTMTDFVVPTAGKEVAIVGFVICNTGTAVADITVTVTNSANAIKATVLKALLNPGELLHIDTKIFLAASATPNKLRVLSSMASVSFLASGDEG